MVFLKKKAFAYWYVYMCFPASTPYLCLVLQKKTGVSWRWLWVLLTQSMSCARAESALNH